MLKLIRASLKTLTTSVSKAYKIYVADGRVGEELEGKIMQHYGFSSLPTANTELVTLQVGSNNFSVAENDGNDKPFNMTAGSVALYLPSSDGTEPKVAIILSKDTVNPYDPMLSLGSDKVISLVAGDRVTILGGPGGIEIACDGQITMQGGNLTVDP